jgi:hypothetical protein
MATLGQELYDAGWRQGARIPSSAPQVHFSLLGTPAKEAPMPEGMSLVLATQDCDLVKPEEKLPYLEAIGCVNDPGRAKSVRANDARFFVLNPDAGTVADRGYGAFLTRDALVGVSAPAAPCGGDLVRARRFATWLGARYDRPALPTPAVEHVQRPLSAAIRALCSPGKPHEELNRELHEIRVIADLESGPPFTLDLLIFLLTEQAPIEAAEFAIAEVIERAGFAVAGIGDDPGIDHSVVLRNWQVFRPSELSIALYHGAIPIPLAYESVRGDEVIGAEPLDAESA